MILGFTIQMLSKCAVHRNERSCLDNNNLSISLLEEIAVNYISV